MERHNLTAVIFLYFVWLLLWDCGIRAAIKYNIKDLALMALNDYIASASVSINSCTKLFLAYQIMYTVAWIHGYNMVWIIRPEFSYPYQFKRISWNIIHFYLWIISAITNFIYFLKILSYQNYMVVYKKFQIANHFVNKITDAR